MNMINIQNNDFHANIHTLLMYVNVVIITIIIIIIISII